ncbi:tRNA (adenosine(37)-N6)-threonylcarbamoyltransferase complex ATPase subunit type 1 TsaE [Patescibacteria group bacterium]|nr:tRNA (adenosine(37)-N6)-threonylcarbamoyltransferase complex ATPase subunit type 1 TsaE [Patescibacteria group bacterium]MBU4142598.1 tRNA (adenosine(37)-N6)-threonylcarbamoyltransferase complex ATPase subunit type 1 TsaE [Patescibacteria group bacterium]
MEFITTSARETHQLANKILKELFVRQHQGALVLALQGELGAGKTTFIQGLAQALGVPEKVLSPTFVIMKRFGVRPRIKYGASSLGRDKKSPAKVGTPINFYHLDCYRIEKAKDLDGLRLEEILKDKKNLVVIEWAERIKNVLPKDAVWIKFEHRGEDKRRIRIINYQ